MKENHTWIILVSPKVLLCLLLLDACFNNCIEALTDDFSTDSQNEDESMKTFSQGLIKSSSTQLAQ